MKKKYYPPEWEMITFHIQNNVLLTGSVEEGGNILDPNNDDIPEP